MTLIFELDLEIVKMNQRDRYPGQRSFSLEVIVRTHSAPSAPPEPLDWLINIFTLQKLLP